MHKITTTVLILAVMTLNSCQKNEIEKDDQTNLNNFSMKLNDHIWRPSIMDTCNKAFSCQWSGVNEDNYYSIEAYKDAKFETFNYASLNLIESENFFKIHFKVDQIGSYPINGTFYAQFESYARLTMNDSNGKRRYYNKKDGNSFKVEVTDMPPAIAGFEPGIQGTFSGVLYNEDDPHDSLSISDGKFSFLKINFNNFNQCND
jgi:hypothetical protein